MPRKLTPDETKQLKEFSVKAFNTLDLDKSGQIEVKECEQLLRQFNESSEFPQKIDDATIKRAIEDFIRLADKNADGKVSYDELYTALLVALDAHE